MVSVPLSLPKVTILQVYFMQTDNLLSRLAMAKDKVCYSALLALLLPVHLAPADSRQSTAHGTTLQGLCRNAQVTDTEDLIALDLDHRRNELVALNLVVNCIMLMFALVSAVTGAFGMNLATVRTSDDYLNDTAICTLSPWTKAHGLHPNVLRNVPNLRVHVPQWMGVMDVTASRVRVLHLHRKSGLMCVSEPYSLFLSCLSLLC